MSNFTLGQERAGEVVTPPRKGLILGSAMVALAGLMKERALEARHFGYADSNLHAGYALAKMAMETLRRGGAFVTDDERILDLMAHTRQTMRVSYEEWDACVPVHSKAAASPRRVAAHSRV